MANQPTEESAKKLTGLERIADELHSRFCTRPHHATSDLHSDGQHRPVCWYWRRDFDWSKGERATWLQKAREINDIVREELVR